MKLLDQLGLQYLIEKFKERFDLKQDKLTAGDNITITSNTISATDTIVDISGKLNKSNDTLETYTEKIQATTGIINLSLANIFTDTPSASRTYSITNAKSGVAHSFTLIVTMGTTIQTLTFPASVKWQDGEIPDLTAANKTYVLTFMTVDGGTNWLGMFGGEFDSLFIPEGYVLATDDDFFWFDTSEMGEGAPPSFYLYTGTKEYVVIPEKINGELVTSTFFMFVDGANLGQENTPVKGVATSNSNVTDMSYMFASSSATTLDLSSFDTSNVTNMMSMFDSSSATTLDLSSFDTSNVTNMSYMFYNSSATTLDLSSFDTSNVTDMSSMFAGSLATSLDLSNFDTSNVTNMMSMFEGSSATTGYARTQADADRFNNSSGKPSALVFVVK